MHKRLRITFLLVSLFIFSHSIAFAEFNWAWVCSDRYYSHFYDPDTVTINKASNGSILSIELWRKTTFSYAGAENTIKESNKTQEFPDPSQLAYAVQRIKINPQWKKITYFNITYYNSNKEILWSEEKEDEYELEPYFYDEKFFYRIADIFLHTTDTEMISSKDRWITVEYLKYSNGNYITAFLDVMTITHPGNSYYGWVYTIVYNSDGNAIEAFKEKKLYDLEDNSVTLVKESRWVYGEGWVMYQKNLHNYPKKYSPGSFGEYEIQQLKEFVKNNKEYILRYTKPVNIT